jgi:hypothetical protein
VDYLEKAVQFQLQAAYPGDQLMEVWTSGGSVGSDPVDSRVVREVEDGGAGHGPSVNGGPESQEGLL